MTKFIKNILNKLKMMFSYKPTVEYFWFKIGDDTYCSKITRYKNYYHSEMAEKINRRR